MAIKKGFIQCTEPHCSEVVEVWQAEGKRSTLYTKCKECGTNQSHGGGRQKYLAENLKVSIEELDIEVIEAAIEKKAVAADTVEKAAIPSKNAASGVSDDAQNIPIDKPKEIPVNIPKGSPTAPPVLLGVLALIMTLIAAAFAARKPTNKPKGQTA
jgi:hypothetical protein